MVGVREAMEDEGRQMEEGRASKEQLVEKCV
jgi:hypothetical protein